MTTGGELLSLRLLLVGAPAAERDLWLRGAGGISVPVDLFAQEPAEARITLERQGADICIVDAALPEQTRSAVIAAARSTRPAPLVFVCGATRQSGDRVDGVLRRPATIEEARKFAELCARTRIPTRVLIVDDSSTMRSIVRKILAASRFSLDIHEAPEGIAALKEVRSGRFGLVFLDYQMPGFNGFETLWEIKREHPQVAVVMMTSTVDNAIADRAHAAGVMAFLKKPFYLSDVETVLERYFGFYG
ncbi:MAG TPA: response regulator [Pseudolabrys sp.]|jgi:CheY-like chemotaxis protein|nr:response regulator [Pseudolabrys sp.]